MMTLRQIFLKAMRREGGGYVPKNISLCPFQIKRFEKEYGHADIAREWRLPIRRVGLPFRASTSDFSPWLGEAGNDVNVDEWGIGLKMSDRNASLGQYIHPLKDARSAAEILEYPFPELPDQETLARVIRQCADCHQQGFPVEIPTCPAGGTSFWPAYKLRGMENLLCDLHTAPEMAVALLDKVCELCAGHARLAASTGADIIFLADDLGTQISTYVSPADFRHWFKPRLARVIASARQVNPDILVHFHSDGAVRDFIPDFIEIGIDILNPIQPECMDPLEIKREYGDKLSLSGCVGTQTTMPFDSPAEVRAKTRLYCEQAGQGGGLWIAPTHVIEPEVPWENIMAFIETADEYAQL